MWTVILDTHQSSEVECLCFQLVKEIYIQNVNVITEVMNYVEPVPVPGAPSEVLGILNVRGAIVTIISGHKLLDLQEQNIILIKTTTNQYGITVDAVKKIITLPENSLESSESLTKNKLIKGTIEYNDELLIFTDLTQVPEKLVNNG